jgi:hypothetical protein
MTKIIAIVTLVWWNPATANIEETAMQFQNVGNSIAQCEATVQMEAFWLSVRRHVPATIVGVDGSYEPVAMTAQCVTWREA